jgi:hypothetical protein
MGLHAVFFIMAVWVWVCGNVWWRRGPGARAGAFEHRCHIKVSDDDPKRAVHSAVCVCVRARARARVRVRVCLSLSLSLSLSLFFLYVEVKDP